MRTKTCLMLVAFVALAAAATTAWAQYPGGYGGYPQAMPGYPMMAYPPQMPAVVPASAVASLSNCDSCGGACDGSCDAGCDSPCGGCGTCPTCCQAWEWNHRFTFIGEFLYLRARDAEVPYAVEFNGPINSPPSTPIQVGRVATVDQDYDIGYRFGVGFAIDCTNEIRATYTRFDTAEDDQVIRQSPNTVVRSMVRHPSTITANTDDVIATGRHDIEFNLIDLEYRSLFAACCDYRMAWFAGLRYGGIDQSFMSTFSVNGSESVRTDVDFEGIGIRAGLDGERYLGPDRIIMLYGKASVSLLAGEARGSYDQFTNFDQSVVATAWDGNRIISIWDLELGAGWKSRCDTWRVTAGYSFSLWDNLVKTDEFIQAVQRNNFIGLGDHMTFDGLIGRVEARY